MSEEELNISNDDKNIAVITHVLGIFFSFIPGLVIWLMKKEDNTYISEQAKESMNFQITIAIGYFIAGITSFIFIGFLLLPLVGIACVVLSVIAAIACSKGEQYKYPFALRLIS